MLIERIWETIEDIASRGGHKVRIKVKYEDKTHLKDSDVIKLIKELCPGIECSRSYASLFLFNWKPKYKQPPDMYDPTVRNNEKLIDDKLAYLQNLTHEGRKKMFMDLVDTIKNHRYIRVVDNDIDSHNKIKLLREYHKYIRKQYFPFVKKWEVIESSSCCFILNIS